MSDLNKAMGPDSRPAAGRVLARGLDPGRLISPISAGLVATIINVIIPVSFAALIFSGRASGLVSQGIGLLLLGSIAGSIVLNLASSFSGTLSTVQDAPNTLMAVMAAGLMNSLPAAIPGREVFLSVVAAMAAATLLTGASFLLLGQFRLGSLIRYLPYPVVGGFLAGTGWLLTSGGIGMMSGVDLRLSGLAALFAPGMLLRWLPGLLLGIAMMAAASRFHHFLVLPGLILGAVAAFFAAALLSGSSVAQLTAGGWLLGPFPSGALWRPITPADLAQVHWGYILAEWGNLLTVVLVSAVSFLLTLSGIEIAVHHDMDLDRELRAVGAANLLSGLLGGTVNFHALATTQLNHRLSRDSRITGWVAAACCGAVLVFGAGMLNDMPRMVLGSLLVFLGVSFLYDWVIRGWQRFTHIEYAILLVILAVIAVFGYLPGVGVGLLAAVGLFVVNYSQVNVVKHILTGDEYQSRVTRPAEQKALLALHGKSMLILQLQGYIFFGTAHRLLDLIRQKAARASQAESLPLENILLDFRQVSGLDSTALLSFEKMDQLARQQGFLLALSGLSPHLRRVFAKTALLAPGGDIRSFPDLDHAVEWCEQRILDASPAGPEGQACSLVDELGRIFPDPDRVQRLLSHFEQRELAAGARLIHQGDEPDEVYMIESGRLTAQLEIPGREPVRLETMCAGRVVGELGFYLGIQRTASVVADEASVVYQLSRKQLEAMEAEDSASAAVFHQILAHLLAERTAHLIDSVNALQH